MCHRGAVATVYVTGHRNPDLDSIASVNLVYSFF